MDPITLSSMVVAALSPLISAGTTEIGKTAFKDVYAALKERLKKKPEGKQAIDKFEANPSEGRADFERQLTQLIEVDKDLFQLLQEALEKDNYGAEAPLVHEVKAEKVVIAKNIEKLDM